MWRLLFILLVYWSINSHSVLIEAMEKSNTPRIVIEPVTSQEFGFYVVKKELDSLNMTCSVYDNSSNDELRYSITWTSSNSQNYTITQLSDNAVSLRIAQVEQKDEGTYTCAARPLDGSLAPLTENVMVTVVNGRKCGETMFSCNLSKYANCIHHRFTCDGFQDCELGEDENQHMCGFDPCTNKLPCQDHTAVVRCIPKAWCCTVGVDVNCTVRAHLSCCPKLSQTVMDDRRYYDTVRPNYYNMAFAIYTVIGCAVILTVLVIAICRVYTRNQWSRSLTPASTHLNQNEAVMYYERQPVTYNISQEVDVQPPSYSQVVSMQGPPPPYTPVDMLETQALLTQKIDSDQHPGTTSHSDTSENYTITNVFI